MLLWMGRIELKFDWFLTIDGENYSNTDHDMIKASDGFEFDGRTLNDAKVELKATQSSFQGKKVIVEL